MRWQWFYIADLRVICLLGCPRRYPQHLAGSIRLIRLDGDAS